MRQGGAVVALPLHLHALYVGQALGRQRHRWVQRDVMLMRMSWSGMPVPLMVYDTQYAGEMDTWAATALPGTTSLPGALATSGYMTIHQTEMPPRGWALSPEVPD
ncbi:MAG: hypothetical protein PHT57_10980 [Rhodoferax sp.]|nr:hypothetical protein [Rhodoferax sp.]